MVAACEGVVVHSTGRSHVESIAVGSDGRVAVASSALTGDLWDGRIQLLRCGSGAASAARTATAAPAAPDGAATQLGSIETGVGSCDVAWLSSSLLVCADDRGDVSILRLPPGHEADASSSEVSHSLPITPPPPPTHPHPHPHPSPPHGSTPKLESSFSRHFSPDARRGPVCLPSPSRDSNV